MNRSSAASSRSSLRRSGAFTLIEAVIAIVVLSVAIPSMFFAITDAQKKRGDPILASRARWLATERLEDIIADRHAASRGWSYVTSANYNAEPSLSGFPGFSRTVSIAETGPDLATAGTGYKTVTVSVSFTDARGNARTVALATVLTDYTP